MSQKMDILDMLAAGEISPAEAEVLLDALPSTKNTGVEARAILEACEQAREACEALKNQCEEHQTAC